MMNDIQSPKPISAHKDRVRYQVSDAFSINNPSDRYKAIHHRISSVDEIQETVFSLSGSSFKHRKKCPKPTKSTAWSLLAMLTPIALTSAYLYSQMTGWGTSAPVVKTRFPTISPSSSPSMLPTFSPTGSPTDSPTQTPTIMPTQDIPWNDTWYISLLEDDELDCVNGSALHYGLFAKTPTLPPNVNVQIKSLAITATDNEGNNLFSDGKESGNQSIPILNDTTTVAQMTQKSFTFFQCKKNSSQTLQANLHFNDEDHVSTAVYRVGN